MGVVMQRIVVVSTQVTARFHNVKPVGALRSTTPLLGLGLAGCSWWIIVVLATLTVFLRGADAAMRWLDVIDRVRGRSSSSDEQRPRMPDPSSRH